MGSQRGYPRTYTAIRDMVREALLEVPTARDIVRRSGVRTAAGPSGSVPSLWGAVTPLFFGEGNFYHAGAPDALGWQMGVPRYADELYFPTYAGAPSGGHLYADRRGFTEARLLVTVTSAGPLDSYVGVSVIDGGGDHGFVGEQLKAPLDVEGLHITPWREIAYPPDPPDSVALAWFVYNPNFDPVEIGEDLVGLGLCHLQAR